MHSLLSSPLWLSGQLGHLLQVIREREVRVNRVLEMITTMQGDGSPGLEPMLQTVFSGPRQDSICKYSGTVSSLRCLKVLSKRTTDILSVFEGSIKPLKETYFYSEQIQFKLADLKDLLNGFILSKSVDYSTYVDLVLGFSRYKIDTLLQKLPEFLDRDRGVWAVLNLPLDALPATPARTIDRKRRSVSVGKRVPRVESERYRERDKQRDNEKQTSQRICLVNNILTNYGPMDLSRTQFLYHLEFEDEAPHKSKLLFLITERNKRIKDQVSDHNKYIDRLDDKTMRLPGLDLGHKLPDELSLSDQQELEKQYMWVRNQSESNPEKSRSPNNNPISHRKRSQPSRGIKLVASNIQLIGDTAKNQRKLCGVHTSRRGSPQKVRSYSKIFDPLLKQAPNKLASDYNEFRKRISQTKLIWHNITEETTKLFNLTAPAKSLRMKKYSKIGLLKSNKLLMS